VFRTRLVKPKWITGFSWPLFLAAMLFIIPSTIIAWLSLTRADFFQQHLENISFNGYCLLALCFGCYLLAWLALIIIKPASNNYFLWAVAAIIFIISLVTVPLLSRDVAAYALNADMLYYGHFNPYTEPISLGRQSWQLGSLWWLNYPSPYGPLFLLTIGLPFLVSAGNLLAFIFSYKVLVLLAFGLSGYLFSRCRRQFNLPSYLDWLFWLNPALIINWLTEGHQEVFIVLILLWLLFNQIKTNFSQLGLLAPGFIKITAVILWPLSWFKNQIFNWRRFWLGSVLFATVWLLFFAMLGLTPLNFWHKNLAFANQHCFYTCSPLIMASNQLPTGVAEVLRLLLFVGAYLAALYFFLFRKYQPLKFIVWSFMALFFINTKWLTPWYPTLIIPFSLLIKERKYLILSGLLTAYCLWHYLGL